MFRPKLSHIANEKRLFEYFTDNAGYNPNTQLYQCAGIMADDTAILFQKLKVAWMEDRKADKEERKQKMDEMFLAKINCTKQGYMQDEIERFEKMHIVKAKDEHEAYEKARNYYESKTSDYSVYYYVENIEICDVIE